MLHPDSPFVNRLHVVWFDELPTTFCVKKSLDGNANAPYISEAGGNESQTGCKRSGRYVCILKELERFR